MTGRVNVHCTLPEQICVCSWLRLLARKGGIPQSISYIRMLQQRARQRVSSLLHSRGAARGHGDAAGAHPVLHQSTLLLWPLPSMISGAMYSTVPIKELLRAPSLSMLPCVEQEPVFFRSRSPDKT